MTHTVQPKETLYSISRKYGVSVTQIQEWNGLSDTALSVGQDLIVSADGGDSQTDSFTTGGNNDSVSSNQSSSSDGGSRSGNISVQKINKGGYNSIIISYPTAYGSDQSNPMRDNYPSPNTVNTAGVSYVGKSTFEAQRGEFDDLLPQPFYGDLLHYIGKNEGCFDAVNSYDKAIFSFGFIQFTGAVASGSILTKVLQRFKNYDSSAFYNCFTKYGMDVSSVFTCNGRQGDDAYRAVANDLELTGAFIASGFEREMIRAQVAVALEEYVNRAVSDNTAILIFNQNVSLNRFLYSEGGIALRVDLAVNRGLGGSLAALQKAVTQVCSQSGIYSVIELPNIDEQSVVQAVANNDVEAWKKARVQKLLSSNFSFSK
jgi:hypothetical protein